MEMDKERLQAFFQDEVGVPRDKVKYYVGWLNRFLQFYKGGLDDISENDLRAFGNFLESRGYEDRQSKRGQVAPFSLAKKVNFRDTFDLRKCPVSGLLRGFRGSKVSVNRHPPIGFPWSP